jgi:anti-sigma factor RsiW
MKPVTPPPSFLAEVMARTSGSACPAVEARLCALVDGELDTTDRVLVEGHLVGCAPCAAQAAALRDMAVDLPWLAQVEPHPGFLAEVLRATPSPRPFPSGGGMAEWWRGWVLRPRFAAEAAYVGVVLLCLTFVVPGAPFQAFPQRALRNAQSLEIRASDTLERIRRSPRVRSVEESARENRDRVRTLFKELFKEKP